MEPALLQWHVRLQSWLDRQGLRPTNLPSRLQWAGLLLQWHVLLPPWLQRRFCWLKVRPGQ